MFGHNSLQEDLNTLVNWQNEWQMSFNAKKCFTMRLTHAKKQKVFNYKLGESILQETKSHSYLGVTLTSDLSWNDHINQTSSKSNRTLGFVMRNLHQCPQDIKVSAYKTLVRPLVEYSSSVWEPYTKNLINKLESVQRRAARFCVNDFKSKSPGCVTNMIKKLEWESLADRRQTRRLVIFHKAVHGHLSIPLGNLTQPATRPSRHTNSRAYTTLTASKDCYKHSFMPKTIRDWNSLPESVVTITDSNQFKEATKLYLATKKQD